MMWELETDPRFHAQQHLEQDGMGRVNTPLTLNEEGKALALTIFQEMVETRKLWWSRSLDNYIISIGPDKSRHAMRRDVPIPTLFKVSYPAICGVEYSASEWTLCSDTSRDAVCQQGVLTCDYCQGLLAVQALGE